MKYFIEIWGRGGTFVIEEEMSEEWFYNVRTPVDQGYIFFRNINDDTHLIPYDVIERVRIFKVDSQRQI